MEKSRSDRRLRYAAWGSALVIAMVAAAPGSGRAEEEENSIWNLDTRFLRGFMTSLGLKNLTEEQIEYRERSPLVLPPSRDLPAPQAAAPQPPAWPVDPDVTRRRAAIKKKETRFYDEERAGASLRPSELDPPGAARSAARGGGPSAATGEPGNALPPSSLGYFGGLFSWTGLGAKEEVGAFTREPPRSSLIAPPPGYQTPSEAQPYGVTTRAEPSRARRKAEDIPVGNN